MSIDLNDIMSAHGLYRFDNADLAATLPQKVVYIKARGELHDPETGKAVAQFVRLHDNRYFERPYVDGKFGAWEDKSTPDCDAARSLEDLLPLARAFEREARVLREENARLRLIQRPTVAQVDEVWESLGGHDKWLKSFGYRNFAKALFDKCLTIGIDEAQWNALLRAAWQAAPDGSPRDELIEAMAQIVVNANLGVQAIEALDAALTNWGMTQSGDTKADIQKLIALEVQAALDPAVSEQAQALYDKGRADAANAPLPPLPTIDVGGETRKQVWFSAKEVQTYGRKCRIPQVYLDLLEVARRVPMYENVEGATTDSQLNNAVEAVDVYHGRLPSEDECGK